LYALAHSYSKPQANDSKNQYAIPNLPISPNPMPIPLHQTVWILIRIREMQMIQFFEQMIRLPFTTAAYGLEILAKTLKGFQQVTDRSGTQTRVPITPSSPVVQTRPNHPNPTTPPTFQQEERPMPDQDLSGDDLKYGKWTPLSRPI
jgi:hypothetical protein